MSNATTHLKTDKQLVPALRFKGFEGDWHLRSLSEFINDMGSGWSPTCLAEAAKKGEWGSLKTTSITWKGYAPEENKKLPEKLEPREDIEVCIDDILITRVGPKDRVGVVVHVDKEWSKLMVSDNMFRLKLKKGIDPSFAPLILGSYSVQKEWKRKIAGLASAQVVINQKTLNKTTLKLPVLPEQQKIASFLSAVDEKIQQLTKKKALLDRYKKGVMQQLFSGQLRFKDENGNDFPDWEEKRLGMLSEIVGGGTPETAKGEYWGGEVQWFTPTEIGARFISDSVRTITQAGLKKSSAKLLPVGTILFTSRATIAELGFAMKECSTNQGFQSLIVNEKNNSEFIYYLIKKNKKEFIRKSQGSTFLEISSKEMKKMKFNIPCIKEQQKIATYLSSLDTKIETVNKRITQTQTFKKGLLQQMFV